MIRNEAILVQSIVTADGVLSVRPEAVADEAFLFSLFESVKGPEVALMPVEDGMKRHLLAMQFRAMSQSYQGRFPVAAFLIIMMDDRPVGRLIADTADDRVHVAYVALLPEWRHRGIASALMRGVLTRCGALGLACEAVVAIDNIPSLRLWAGLGFTERGRDAADVVFEWRP